MGNPEAGDETRLRLQGNAAFAEQSFARAVESAIDHPSSIDLHVLHGNRAAAYVKLGLFADALTDAEVATSIQPTWSKGWYRKAAALEALGRIAEAEEAAGEGADFGDSKELVAQRVRLRGLCLQSAIHNNQQATVDTDSAITEGSNSISTVHPAAAVEGAGQPEVRLEAMRPGGRLSEDAVAALLPLELRSGHRFHHSQDGVDTNLLLLLHGLGDRPDAFAALAQRMQLPQTAALALAGPSEVPFTDGGRAWFHSFDQEGNPVTGASSRAATTQRDASLAATLRSFQSALDRLSDRTKGGWHRYRIHVFGFSQGGAVALHLAAANSGSRKFGSCAAVSAAMFLTSRGALPSALQPQPSTVSSGGGINGSSKATPVLITHGDSDAVVARHDVIATCSFLRATYGGPAEFVPFAKGHTMISSPNEMRTLMSFWAEHLGARPVAENDNEEIVELSA